MEFSEEEVLILGLIKKINKEKNKEVKERYLDTLIKKITFLGIKDILRVFDLKTIEEFKSY